MIIKPKTMTRRHFLQGVGGFTLAVPFLSSLAPWEALAASQPPMRFVYWVGRFGRDIKEWYPAQNPTQISPEGVYYSSLGTAANGPISRILSTDFDPVRSKMTIIRGMDGMQPNADGHSSGMCTTASGWVNNALGYGYSIDAILEESAKFNANNPSLGALRVSLDYGLGYQIGVSFSSRSGALVRISPENSLQTLYNKYFNPTALQQRSAANSRMAPVTNKVMESFKATMNSRRISSEDKYQLDNYMSLLSQAQAKMGIGIISCQEGKQPASAYTSASLYHSAAIDLEVAALACGMTNIVVHCNIHHDDEMVPNDGEAHSAAHGGISSASDSGRAPIEQWKLNKWAMSRVAELLKKLDSVSESNGTLLDNTLFMYGNVESRGFHNFNDMPVIMAGAKGKLRQNMYLDYRPRPLKVISPIGEIIAGRPINNALISAFKICGLEAADYQRFGLPGFGVYDQFDAKTLGTHYAPFLGSHVNDVLPYLVLGA